MPPQDSLDRKLAILGCLCIFLAFSFFSYAGVLNLAVQALLGEAGVVEVLTAACLFLASLLLFAVAKKEKAHLRRCIYLLGGLAMAISLGEELSWGQHIFGFTTPDFLIGLNMQQEFNVHNIFVLEYFFDFLAMAPLLLSTLTCVAFFCRKENVLGIPLPSPPLMLGFLLIIYPEYLIPDRRLWLIMSGPGILLLSFFLFAWFSKQVRHCIFTAALLTMPVATLYAGYRSDHFAWHTHNEIFEHLLALACLFYAAELWQAKGGDGAASWRPLRPLAAALKALAQRLPPPWLVASALMAAGSSGLVAVAHMAT